jgi:COMPASS component SWD1
MGNSKLGIGRSESPSALVDSQLIGHRGSLACAVFSPCGSRIYAGTTRGLLLIIDPVTRYVSSPCLWSGAQRSF